MWWPSTPGFEVFVSPSFTSPVTDLLIRWSGGDSAARDALVPLVYQELRKVARKCLAGQRANQTLQPTALVHEAYLRLVKADSMEWRNRAHFFAVAATMMRQILVDHARNRSAGKRGGGAVTVALDVAVTPQPSNVVDLILLDNAMRRLAVLDERQCRIVELRFFGGLSIDETARIVDISPATTKREWATARLWLHQAMKLGVEA